MASTQVSDAPRSSMFMQDPEDFTLVLKPGAFYDPRVHYPVDGALVAAITELGVLEPVIATKIGDELVVVDGRQRVKAAQEAVKLNPALKGKLKVPTIIRRGDELRLENVGMAANIHVTDDPITFAEKLARHMDLNGGDLKATALYAGRTTVSVQQNLKLLDLAKSVQKALRDGKLSGAAGMELYGLSVKDQEEKLKILVESGKGSASAVKRLKKADVVVEEDDDSDAVDEGVNEPGVNVKMTSAGSTLSLKPGTAPATKDGPAPATKDGPAPAKKSEAKDVPFPSRPSLAVLRKLTDHLASENEDETVFLLRWITGEAGDVTTFKKVGWLREAVKAIEAPKAKPSPEPKPTGKAVEPKAASKVGTKTWKADAPVPGKVVVGGPKAAGKKA